MRIDFHVHTNASIDSTIRPADLARKSKGLGIIPALADHNSVASHAAMRSLGAPFIPAEEVCTDKGDLIGLYVSELIPKRTPFLEAMDRIRQQGGIAYLPHMFDYGRAKGHASEAESARADIIEVFNARCLKPEYNRNAAAFARKHALPGAAGSDSHFLFEFGFTFTELPDFDIEEPRALMRAIRARNPMLATRPAPFYVRGTTTLVAGARRLARALRPPKPI